MDFPENYESALAPPTIPDPPLPDLTADFPSAATEPAIQGLVVDKFLTLNNSSVALFDHYSPDPYITTQAGIKGFILGQDGIKPKSAGLYRLTTFNRVFTSTDKCTVLTSVVTAPGNYTKRYKLETFQPNSSGDIALTQILRLRPQDELKIFIRAWGVIRISSGFHSSGFTLERIM